MTNDEKVRAIRDEIGTGDPTDEDLDAALEEHEGWWRAVAVSILKRRRADLIAGGQAVTSVSLSGVVSVGFSAGNAAALSAQIARLESELSDERDLCAGPARLTRLSPRG